MLTQDDIVYMIVTDRFLDGDPENNGDIDPSSLTARHGGDLLGIVRQLPYLRDLGVTALWITPCYPNGPDGYHGYHPNDFETVDPHLCSPELGSLGSPEVVRRFVELAHEHELKVVLDLVVNHTGPDHPWLRQNPHWFNPNTPSMEKCWLWGLPDLNHEHLDVNTYFIHNVLFWMQVSNADAIRIDAVRHVESEFWQLFNLFAQGCRPDCSLLAEVWEPEVGKVAVFQREYGFDSMFDFPLQMAIEDVFIHDHSFGRIARPELGPGEPEGILNMDKAYRNAYQCVTFLENHDTTRFYHLAGGDSRRTEAVTRTRLALTFILTTRGIPQLYYGAELLLDGAEHPDNRRDMPWERLHSTDETGVSARAMLAFTRHLIRLRKESHALKYGALMTLYVTPTFYAFARAYIDDVRLVVLNNAWEPAEVTIPIQANDRIPTMFKEAARDGLPLVNDLDPVDWIRIENGSVRVRVPGKSGAIYRPLF